LNEPRVLVQAITFLGIMMELVDHFSRASELYAEGLELARSIGDRWFAGLCHLCLFGEGFLRQPTTKPESIHEQLQAVVAEWRSIGDPRITTIALNNLSLNAVRLGRYDEARAALEESISLNISTGDRWILGFAYRGLGLIAQAQGEHQQAIEMFRKSQDAFTQVGARQDKARMLVEMSRSLFALGNDPEAERGWREALLITTETQSPFVALEALVGIAMLKAKRGEDETALDLQFIVLNHPASLQETKDRAEKLRAEIESRLTPQQVESVQARTNSFEQVVSQTLEQRS
jgi:tetratricopeptide (TPR) repeat protein